MFYLSSRSTCQKAKKWLDANGVEYEERNIKEENPTEEELRKWHQKSGLPLKKFFNTSGLLYKNMNLKEKLASMTEDEQYRLLPETGRRQSVRSCDRERGTYRFP